MVIAILFLIIQILFAILFFYMLIAFITGAPFVPSTREASEAMVRLASIKKGMTIYDLGSGNGKLLFLAAEKGAIAKGIEINPYLVLFTTAKAFFFPYKNRIKVYWKNFWKTNIQDADVVFIYLLPWKMDRLENRLRQQLKKGSIIVSNSFIFPHITCVEKDEKNHVYAFKI